MSLLFAFASAGCLNPEDETYVTGANADDDDDDRPEDDDADDAEGSSGEEDEQTQEEDIAEYEAVTAELEQRRTEFQGEKADEITGVGSRLFWLEFPGWDPVLRSFDPAGDRTVPYTFWIGGGDAYNYRASEDAVLTAVVDGDVVLYRLYAIGEPETLLTEVEMLVPQDEQRWWAYAVDGTTGYIVNTEDGADLYRFSPGSPLEPVLDLESDAGADVGIFWEFGVEGSTMIFVESGRIWELDLGSGVANWLGNEQQVTGTVNFDSKGAAFGAADGLYYFDYATKSLTDVDLRIEENEYALNKTFASSHLHAGGDWTRQGSRFIYQGMSGIFSYDLESDALEPILLDPRLEPPNRLVYRNPQVVGGEIFVQGLFSEHGSVGADGPIYRVK